MSRIPLVHQDIKVAAVYSTFLLPKLNNQTYTLCLFQYFVNSIDNQLFPPYNYPLLRPHIFC